METAEISFIDGGTVTSPEGFFAGAIHAGIKKDGKSLDLGILFSEAVCNAAAVFTKTRMKSAPVRLDQQKLKESGGKVAAIVANSGCANAYTGDRGLANAEEMAAVAAEGIGVDVGEVLVASTGVTGKPLPMDKIRNGISCIIMDRDGGHDMARAIMTTDTVPKEAAVSVKTGGGAFSIGAIAKGSGMIHPNMATMFCFITTDAPVEPGFLDTALRNSADISLNMITVDGDTSPSDTVVLMANGKAGGEPISEGGPMAGAFQQALDQLMQHMAKALARDGEGANRLIEVNVSGAAGIEDARKAAREIAGSVLVKTAVYGGDPNWGRLIMALSNSGAELDETKIDLDIGDIQVLKNGAPLPFSEADVIRVFKQDTVPVNFNLNLGGGSATAWGCDMSEAYVRINSEYMT